MHFKIQEPREEISGCAVLVYLAVYAKHKCDLNQIVPFTGPNAFQSLYLLQTYTILH